MTVLYAKTSQVCRNCGHQNTTRTSSFKWPEAEATEESWKTQRTPKEEVCREEDSSEGDLSEANLEITSGLEPLELGIDVNGIVLLFTFAVSTMVFLTISIDQVVDGPSLPEPRWRCRTENTHRMFAGASWPLIAARCIGVWIDAIVATWSYDVKRDDHINIWAVEEGFMTLEKKKAWQARNGLSVEKMGNWLRGIGRILTFLLIVCYTFWPQRSSIGNGSKGLG
ncbi:hypothetical protein VTL71DRAFT_5179 [Oculimacula yallundae]|uniref:Uncharacterized protein n=1 Tax=Oculimacula yallundae TaxID=86028 RepID=A0ABR4C0D6_9HELO